MTGAPGWGRGYPVHEAYPASWHGYEAPAHLHAICALMGVAWDVEPSTPLAIADVGCGVGYTSLVLAAGNPGSHVVGIDYNPAQIAEARAWAAAAGVHNVRFVEADLADLDGAILDGLPDFDLVNVHGVWSWVADPVREGVLSLLRKRLKAGGLAYISYNALPAAAGAQGLARLVRAELLAAADTDEGLTRASEKVKRLLATEPANLPPSLWRRLVTGEGVKARPGYMLHEFLTAHWRPSFHGDVAAALATARCDYVGSATIDENFAQFSLTPEQLLLWQEAPDGAARELLFDTCVRRPFRRDVFVRGLRRVPRDAAVDRLHLIEAQHEEGDLRLCTQAGEATLPRDMVDTVRAALAQAPRSIAELRSLPACRRVLPAELFAMLTASRCALPLWRMPDGGPEWDAGLAAARRLNALAAQRFAPLGTGSGQLALASPAVGGGLTVEPFELAVSQRMSGLTELSPAQAAPAVVARLLPAGEPPPDDVMSELTLAVAKLIERRRSVWQALGVA